MCKTHHIAAYETYVSVHIGLQQVVSYTILIRVGSVAGSVGIVYGSIRQIVVSIDAIANSENVVATTLQKFRIYRLAYVFFSDCNVGGGHTEYPAIDIVCEWSAVTTINVFSSFVRLRAKSMALLNSTVSSRARSA